MEHLAARDFQDFIFDNAEAWVTIFLSPDLSTTERKRRLRSLYLTGGYQWTGENLTTHLGEFVIGNDYGFACLVIGMSGIRLSGDDVKKTPMGALFWGRREATLRAALQTDEEESLLNITC